MTARDITRRGLLGLAAGAIGAVAVGAAAASAAAASRLPIRRTSIPARGTWTVGKTTLRTGKHRAIHAGSVKQRLTSTTFAVELTRVSGPALGSGTATMLDDRGHTLTAYLSRTGDDTYELLVNSPAHFTKGDS